MNNTTKCYKGIVSHLYFALVHKIQLIASGLKDWACGGRKQQRPGGTEKEMLIWVFGGRCSDCAGAGKSE